MAIFVALGALVQAAPPRTQFDCVMKKLVITDKPMEIEEHLSFWIDEKARTLILPDGRQLRITRLDTYWISAKRRRCSIRVQSQRWHAHLCCIDDQGQRDNSGYWFRSLRECVGGKKLKFAHGRARAAHTGWAGGVNLQLGRQARLQARGNTTAGIS